MSNVPFNFISSAKVGLSLRDFNMTLPNTHGDVRCEIYSGDMRQCAEISVQMPILKDRIKVYSVFHNEGIITAVTDITNKFAVITEQNPYICSQDEVVYILCS